MTNRRAMVRLLAAALLLAGANAALILRDGETVRIMPRTALVDDALSAQGIVMSRPGAPDVVLLRSEEWRLVSPYAADVEMPALRRFLDAFAFAPPTDRLSDSELLRLGRTRANFGLEPACLTVAISNGTSCVRCAFGSATPGRDGVYAAVDGVDSVFVVSSNVFAAIDVSAADLRRRALVCDGMSEVASIDLRCGTSHPFRFLRQGATWTLADSNRLVSAALVRSLVHDVLSARASGYVWPVGAAGEPRDVTQALLAGYGLDPENAMTVTFRFADGTDGYVSFGKEAGDGLVYALAQNGGAIVTVPAELKKLVLADAARFTDPRLFPYEASDVTSVSVTDGATVGLLARGDDGVWRLDAPVAAAADPKAAAAFVARILALREEDRDAGGPRVAVGTNGSPVAVSRKALFGDLRLADLRAKTVTDVRETEVRRIVVTAGNARTSVVRDQEGKAWKIEDGDGLSSVDAPALSAFCRALAPLEAKRVVEIKVDTTDLPRYGLDRPRLVIAIDFTAENALRRNILIGDAVPDGGAFATVGASDAVFVVPEESVRAFSVPLVVTKEE